MAQNNYPVTGRINDHDYVDLGLDVAWATCNVGAMVPFNHGAYYAWGETRTKTDYSLYNSVTNGKEIERIDGNPQYDVARAIWGGTWRLPTKIEMDDLIEKCVWDWLSQADYNGYKVTGPNGNSIFLPTTGFIYGGGILGCEDKIGKYLSATALSLFPKIAYDMVFSFQNGKSLLPESCGIGCCVRPVSTLSKKSKTTTKHTEESPKNDANEFEGHIKEHGYVDLGLSVNWATCNVGTDTPSNYGAYFAWGETTPISVHSDMNCATMGKEIGNIAGDVKHDAAAANWGDPWRMPSREEMDELIIECNWELTSQGGHNGFEITGPTGKRIFLPAAGLCYEPEPQYAEKYGEYWSASPHPDFTRTAYGLVSYHAERNIVFIQHDSRSAGRSIRPVIDIDEIEQMNNQ